MALHPRLHSFLQVIPLNEIPALAAPAAGLCPDCSVSGYDVTNDFGRQLEDLGRDAATAGVSALLSAAGMAGPDGDGRAVWLTPADRSPSDGVNDDREGRLPGDVPPPTTVLAVAELKT